MGSSNNDTSSVSKYLNALRAHPQLSHEAMMELFKSYQGGVVRDERGDVTSWTPEALAIRNKLTTSNLRLVVSIAKTYKNAQIPINDLIQEGNIGLMKAVDRFKWEKGYRFSTYASWWIKQAVGQYVLKRKRTVRLPAHAAAIQRRMISATEKFRDENGQEPTTEELTELVQASRTVVRATMHSSRGTLSLDQPLPFNRNDASGNVATLGDRIVDHCADPFTQLADKQLLEVVKRVMMSLSPKEAAILRLRFGLNEDSTNSEEYPITEEEMHAVMMGKGLT